MFGHRQKYHPHHKPSAPVLCVVVGSDGLQWPTVKQTELHANRLVYSKNCNTLNSKSKWILQFSVIFGPVLYRTAFICVCYATELWPVNHSGMNQGYIYTQQSTNFKVRLSLKPNKCQRWQFHRHNIFLCSKKVLKDLLASNFAKCGWRERKFQT